MGKEVRANGEREGREGKEEGKGEGTEADVAESTLIGPDGVGGGGLRSASRGGTRRKPKTISIVGRGGTSVGKSGRRQGQTIKSW